MEDSKSRMMYVDAAKALGIFLIVLGHNNYDSKVIVFCNSFSLPLFFVMAGFLQGNSNMPFREFIQKRSKRLLLPYFLISMALFVFWFLVGRQYGYSATQNYSPLKNFLGIFYAQGGSEYMDWGIPLWFLPALFVLSVMVYWVNRLKPTFGTGLVLLMIIAGYWLNKTLVFHLPWSIDVVLVIIGFYYGGLLLRRFNVLELIQHKSATILMAFILLVFHLLLFGQNVNLAVYHGTYGSIPLMYINGFLGVFWVIYLFKSIGSHWVIGWIGQNTLPILAFHLIVMTFIKAFFIFALKIEMPIGLPFDILYSILQIAILTPFIIFLNRFVPFVVGQSQKYSLS